ncbi:MAG: aldehyde dehydrogenase family protein [Tateyamaria sp.]|uniref:aldehyde dehydrogenase family protein n=1 Tax=Tateyamaria sp. TaxID=1929288 RepID=UPI00329DB5E9
MEKMNFIAGTWCAGTEWAANINPSDTDDVIGQYARADAAQTKDAIAAAKAAAPGWSVATPQARAEALEAVGGRTFGSQRRAR